MPEEISSPERHRPTACPVLRRLGGSSCLRMTGKGNAPDGISAPWLARPHREPVGELRAGLSV